MAKKKAANLPVLSETLIGLDEKDAESIILEADELWSFVFKKENKVWTWAVLCRKTRQIVAYAIGDRSENTCRKLWNSVPKVYSSWHCYTDFWSAYQAVIPKEQHSAVGKDTGETAHIERWNNTHNVLVVLSEKRSLFLKMNSCMTYV